MMKRLSATLTLSMLAACATTEPEIDLGPPRAGAAGDWPMYNFDAGGSRFNRGEVALAPENVGELVEKWRFPRADSDETIGIIRATPVVVAGCVYFGTTTEPTFYKLDPGGELAWSYQNRDAAGEVIGGPIYGSALVTKSHVYFADTAGFIYALDSKTGRERWKVNTRAEDFPASHPTNGSFASPILADGKLIIASGAGEQGAPLIDADYPCCNGRGFVVALDPETGWLKWTYLVGPEPQEFDPPLEIEDAWGKHVFKYGPSTSMVWATPSYDPELRMVYFGTDTNNSPRRPSQDEPELHTRESCAVIAVDVDSGREKWVAQINPGDVWNLSMRGYAPEINKYLDLSVGDTPKVYTIDEWDGERRVVGVGCKNGAFYVIDAATGGIIHHTPIYSAPPAHPPVPTPIATTIALPNIAGGIQTGCATDGKAVYTNGTDQIRNGTLESFEASAEIPPTAGRVVSLSMDARSENWRHERPTFTVPSSQDPSRTFLDVGDPIMAGLAVANDVIYFTGVTSQSLIAISARDGSVLNEINVGPVWSGPSVSRGRVYVGTGMWGLVDMKELSRFENLYYGIQEHGVLYSFGLPGRDEVDGLAGN